MTKPTEEQIKELESQVYDYEQLHKNLITEIEDHRLKLKALEERADMILRIGFSRDEGALPIAKRRLAWAKAKLLREQLPKATWLAGKEPLKPEDYAIEKVTPKRIYIISVSSGGSSYYDKETGKTACGMRVLNTAKCIEDWQAWKTNSK